MFQTDFLFLIGLIWVIFATIEDIKSREIFNWVNYSLVIFALGFRFFYSFFELLDFSFFYFGLFGFFVFFVLSEIFYYSRMFAGGDARLLASLGAVIPVYSTFFENLLLLFYFLLFFLVVGAVYSLFSSFYLGIKNYSLLKSEIKKKYFEKKKLIFGFLFLSIIFLLFGFFEKLFFYFGIFIFVLVYLWFYLLCVDSAAMVKWVSCKKLTPGDLLVRNVFVGKKIIKKNWEGLSLEEIKIFKKFKKKVLIRNGIPFAPVFLISFVLFWLALKFEWFFIF